MDQPREMQMRCRFQKRKMEDILRILSLRRTTMHKRTPERSSNTAKRSVYQTGRVRQISEPFVARPKTEEEEGKTQV